MGVERTNTANALRPAAKRESSRAMRRGLVKLPTGFQSGDDASARRLVRRRFSKQFHGLSGSCPCDAASRQPGHAVYGPLQCQDELLQGCLGRDRRRGLWSIVFGGYCRTRGRFLTGEQVGHVSRQSLLVGKIARGVDPRQHGERCGLRAVRAKPRHDQQPERPAARRSLALGQGHGLKDSFPGTIRMQ